jgi:hypothetical protein
MACGLSSIASKPDKVGLLDREMPTNSFEIVDVVLQADLGDVHNRVRAAPIPHVIENEGAPFCELLKLRKHNEISS